METAEFQGSNTPGRHGQPRAALFVIPVPPHSRTSFMRLLTAMLLWFTVCVAAGGVHASAAETRSLEQAFRSLPIELRPVTLYWLNGRLTRDELHDQMEAMRTHDRFGGFAPLPLMGDAWPSTEPAYLTDAYFRYYGQILDYARRHGMQVVFYDDMNFPSGTAGGRLQEVHPNDVQKRLDKIEREVTGPAAVEIPRGDGRLMAAVAMNVDTRERINLADRLGADGLRWNAPAGTWKVMLFECVVHPSRHVDYLDAEAVRRFQKLTYDEYYKRFPEHFGTTIRTNFFDDVTLYLVRPGYRTWTMDYNEKFRRRHGFDPGPDYPALWYDIGPQTAAARAHLFGFRCELLSDGYPAVTTEWCRRHGLRSSGHPAGAYKAMTLDMTGDSMKFYEHVDLPLTDAIHFYGHGRPGFKLVTSAASNYDKPRVYCETYGNFRGREVDGHLLYMTAMELFARGLTFILPHGTWYDAERVRTIPEISWRNPLFGKQLGAYNDYCARCTALLDGGRHVADIAVHYPIVALCGFYHFEHGLRYGQYMPPETDFTRVSEFLTCQVRRDFTFIHPDVLDAKCRVEGNTLHLANKVNFEDYRVLILPAQRTIRLSNLRRIREFYDAGGTVIATQVLPRKSEEYGGDDEVCRIIKQIFDKDPTDAKVRDDASVRFRVRIETRGSKIETFINNRLIDTLHDDSHAAGKIGFRQAKGEAAAFDKVVLYVEGGKPAFKDDFADGSSNWTPLDGTTVQDGWLQVSGNELIRNAGEQRWDNFTLEVEVEPKARCASVVFRSVDEHNYYAWQFTQPYLDFTSSSSPGAVTFRPHVKKNGRWQVLKEKSIFLDHCACGPLTVHENENPQGGRAFFLSQADPEGLRMALNRAGYVPDLRFENDEPWSGPPRSDLVFPDRGGRGWDTCGTLSYIHKVKDGRNIYFFANSTARPVETQVRLRGRLTVDRWDPHTGRIELAEHSHLKEGPFDVTRVQLRLEPVRSVFFVEKQQP